MGKTSAKNTQNTTSAVGSVGLGGLNYYSEAFLFKKDNKKANCLLSSPDGSDTVFNVQRENGNQESPSHSLHKILYMSIRIKDLVDCYLIW